MCRKNSEWYCTQIQIHVHATYWNLNAISRWRYLWNFSKTLLLLIIFFFNFELELWSNCCWIVTSIWIGIQVLVLLIEPIQWVWPKSLSWSSLTELNFPGSSARERFFYFSLHIHILYAISFFVDTWRPFLLGTIVQNWKLIWFVVE